jgi:hypothetical protein
MVQYNAAWNQFRSTTRPQDPLMTRYRQINHSQQGQPQIYVFGINYDGNLDTHARDFMYHFSAIKYPVDPNNRSYKPSRARWISHYARQIQLAIANGAAPAISLTIRNLDCTYQHFKLTKMAFLKKMLIMLHMNLWMQVETLLCKQRQLIITNPFQTIERVMKEVTMTYRHALKWMKSLFLLLSLIYSQNHESTT